MRHIIAPTISYPRKRICKTIFFGQAKLLILLILISFYEATNQDKRFHLNTYNQAYKTLLLNRLRRGSTQDINQINKDDIPIDAQLIIHIPLDFNNQGQRKMNLDINSLYFKINDMKTEPFLEYPMESSTKSTSPSIQSIDTTYVSPFGYIENIPQIFSITKKPRIHISGNIEPSTLETTSKEVINDDTLTTVMSSLTTNIKVTKKSKFHKKTKKFTKILTTLQSTTSTRATLSKTNEMPGTKSLRPHKHRVKTTQELRTLAPSPSEIYVIMTNITILPDSVQNVPNSTISIEPMTRPANGTQTMESLIIKKHKHRKHFTPTSTEIVSIETSTMVSIYTSPVITGSSTKISTTENTTIMAETTLILTAVTSEPRTQGIVVSQSATNQSTEVVGSPNITTTPTKSFQPNLNPKIRNFMTPSSRRQRTKKITNPTRPTASSGMYYKHRPTGKPSVPTDLTIVRTEPLTTITTTTSPIPSSPINLPTTESTLPTTITPLIQNLSSFSITLPIAATSPTLTLTTKRHRHHKHKPKTKATLSTSRLTSAPLLTVAANATIMTTEPLEGITSTSRGTKKWQRLMKEVKAKHKHFFTGKFTKLTSSGTVQEMSPRDKKMESAAPPNLTSSSDVPLTTKDRKAMMAEAERKMKMVAEMIRKSKNKKKVTKGLSPITATSTPKKGILNNIRAFNKFLFKASALHDSVPKDDILSMPPGRDPLGSYEWTNFGGDRYPPSHVIDDFGNPLLGNDVYTKAHVNDSTSSDCVNKILRNVTYISDPDECNFLKTEKLPLPPGNVDSVFLNLVMNATKDLRKPIPRFTKNFTYSPYLFENHF